MIYILLWLLIGFITACIIELIDKIETGNRGTLKDWLTFIVLGPIGTLFFIIAAIQRVK